MAGIMAAKALAGKRIGLFGKGGSGKSTIAVLLAKTLQGRGYHVCLLDADSTNVGLHQALGLDQAPVPLMDYYGGTVFGGGLVTCPVDDPTLLDRAETSLEKLPGRYYVRSQAGILLLTAGKIGEQGPGAGCDGPVSKIARDFRILVAHQSPVTLLDFKAGFEDSARGVVTGLDWAILVVDPTGASVHMAANMKDMIDRLKAGEPPATAHMESPELAEIARRIFREARIKGVLLVLNKVDDQETESYLREKLAEGGMKPIGVVHRDRSISRSWLKGEPLEVPNLEREMDRIVDELEAAETAYPFSS
jgi:CO dehydrogenase nickel-insertion accessory protein CooC1